MKKILHILFIIVFPVFSFSQGEWNNWIFGQHAGINFITGSPLPIADVSPLFWARGANGTVSDSLGNLLFYLENNISRSQYVYNRNNLRTPNGNLFNGNYQNDPQPFFIVPDQIDDSSYYIFQMINPSPDTCEGGLFYSVFDMRLDNGLGDIVNGQKFIRIYGGSNTASVLSGTRHHNNKDTWIITHNHAGNNSFLSFLVNSSGIINTPIISPSLLTLVDSSYSRLHTIKISPDGTKLICIADTNAEYCSLNSSTGTVIPLFKIKGTQNDFGQWSDAEFSVDNKFLYLSTGGGGILGSDSSKIFQFDATKIDSIEFNQSRLMIGSELLLWNQSFTGLQRGSDFKIYCNAMDRTDSISVINKPTLKGTLCDFKKNTICLLPSNEALFGFPQFLQNYKAYILYSGLCQNDSVHFSGDVWPPADSIHWVFGDPSSGPSNFSILPTPSHIYSNPGTYTVELFVKHIDHRTDTSWQTITILDAPNPALGQDRSICTGDSVMLDAGFWMNSTYVWDNLSAGLYNISNSQIYTAKTNGNYRVTVTNSDGCIGQDTVLVSFTPQPVVTNNPLSKTICSGESTNIALTSSEPGTMFHWTASLTSGNITGFSADSGLVINHFLINSLSTAGIVTYQITPKVGGCAGPTVAFPVTVNPGDSVKIDISASANNVCAGTSVTFTAIPINPGLTPVYQWKVNGINSGTDSTSFNYNPLNNDVVTCQLTSSNTVCTYNNPATSNAVVMIVNPILVVKDSIAASQNPVCAGTMVTFMSFPTNGGIPSYQWRVNGINVGPNSNVYSFVPNNGDVVSCVLNSNVPCPTGNPATSNTITMIVDSNLLASISISATQNPFCPGTSVTFTAVPSNGGTPVYQWKVNGVNVGINSNTYTYNPVNGDSVRCIMTSNMNCVTNNPASSNKIIMSGNLAPIVTFTSCFDTITTTNAKPIKLKGGIPLGGTYSGSGVSAGYYYPNLAGPGTHQITYSYTNFSLCSASKNSRIHQFASSPVNCGSPITDIRDNKIYQTVQIGTQCWLASNLNFGNTIASTQDQRDNCISEKYCYNDNPANCTNHGGLYQWDEVMRFDETPADQGFCPPGWHIPTENDWNTLFAVFINNGFAGSPLKYSGYSGFNALLSGARHINRGWDFLGFATFFWSSTSRSDNKAWAHGMNDPDPSVSFYPASRINAFSVRCLKD